MGAAVREVVHRRRAQRRLQLRRPACRERPRRQGRLPLDRRAGRHPDADLPRPPARGQQDGQRAQGAGCPDRRPGRDLHADDPGAADRDAGLRADRGAPHGHLRRLLGGIPVGPDQRLRGEGPDHRRRRLSARQGGRAEGRTPTRRSRHADHRGLDRRQADRPGGRDGRRPRPLVARPGRSPVRGLPARRRSTRSTCSTCSTRRARPPSPRASSTRPPATCSGRRSATRRSSTSSRTTCTGARPTSAG